MVNIQCLFLRVIYASVFFFVFLGRGDGAEYNTKILVQSVNETVKHSYSFISVMTDKQSFFELFTFERKAPGYRLYYNTANQADNILAHDFTSCTEENHNTHSFLRLQTNWDQDSVLEPIYHALTLDHSDLVINLKAELGAQWPGENYYLDTNSIDVQGWKQGSVIAVGNSITYTPPSNANWNRILFMLRNPDKPTEDVRGSIYVTISRTVTSIPKISLPKYDFLTHNPRIKINVFDKINLDLSDLNKLDITDPEGDEWQLLEVQSDSAVVDFNRWKNASNKSFIFCADNVGEHIVNYIIGNHRGGFRMGMMNIKVSAKD
ncbi:hypothetical protein ACEUDK_19445 [Aeromonas veronii]